MEAQNPAEAKTLFMQAWNEAATFFEMFTAAHYVARHQPSVQDKLLWDETELRKALEIIADSMQASYPSLYLNIAKDYEDLGNIENAEKNYQLALAYTGNLQAEGYGKMITSGIEKGIERLTAL
jgi:hypothetical protein